ncbi:hypothetical protein DLJ53_18075 [Acuticoccus sediminis]|uniref:Phage regulatory protein Rha (Phage_pRha) n=1 Tax=Acuticoccus sediminis TaxID=2184697 RepID=A0A8B2NUH8_9HYPH|nr:Rha family transcriptional regulator [Acuticoccus sediminis]RAI01124.1 hypothetical protein DLJ53_18075 [Acuticoccus sediminis]
MTILITTPSADGAKPLTMSSLEIAEQTGKRHDHVVRDIRAVLTELHGEGGLPKFGDTYINPQNGQSYPCFRLPHRELMILLTGYSVPLRAKVIDRWETLERNATAASTEALVQRVDGISRMLAKKVTGIEARVNEIVDEAIMRAIAADSRVSVMSHISVKQILADEWRVPAKGRRSIQRKVFTRLQDHCLAHGIKAFRCAHSGTWLFPRHDAIAFVRDHCGPMIREHVDKVTGQGRLPFKVVGGTEVKCSVNERSAAA